MEVKNKKQSIFMIDIKKQAIEEYTAIVRTIVLLEHKHAGSTGFLEKLTYSVLKDLLEFLTDKE